MKRIQPRPCEITCSDSFGWPLNLSFGLSGGLTVIYQDVVLVKTDPFSRLPGSERYKRRRESFSLNVIVDPCKSVAALFLGHDRKFHVRANSHNIYLM